MAIKQDMTETHRAEQALCESPRNFATLVQNIPGTVYRCALDENWTIQFMSDFIEILSGYPIADFVDNRVRSFASIIHPDDVVTVDRQVRAAVAARRPFVMEYRIIHADGGVRWVHERGQAMWTADSRVAWLDGVITDITQRKQAESSLQASEEKYRTMFESMTQGAFYQAADGHLIDVNQSALDIFGLDREAFLAATSHDSRWHVIQEDGSELAPAEHPSMRALATGAAVRNFVAGVYNPRKNAYVWININALPQFRPGERAPYQTFVTLEDITERRQADQALREEREKLRFILDLAPIGIWLQDGTGKLSFVNKAFCQAMGISEQAFLSVAHYAELIPEAFREQCLLSDAKVLASGGVSDNHQQLPFVDGSIHDLRVIKAVKRDEQGSPLALVGLSLDITGELAQQKALRDSEIKFHTMLDWTHDVEYWLSPDGNFIYLTPSVERVTGYPAAAFIADPGLINRIVDPDYHLFWKKHVQSALAMPASEDVQEFDFRIVHRNGARIWVTHTCRPVFDDNGVCLGRRVTLRDVSARKSAEEQIRHLAYFDALTGLPNRRLLMDRLGHALATSQRKREFGALMILDLDHFKALNDTLGHDIGDQLLIEVAQRMQASVRKEDTVSRLGGDEYVVILEDLGPDQQLAAQQAEVVAEKVRTALARPYLLPGQRQEYHSAASIGLTLFDGAVLSAKNILKQADVALYQAKDAGRNAIRFFNPAMQTAIDARIAMENALRQGLQNGEFHLYYQPQVNQHGLLIGAEALLRWLPPNAEPIPPAQFIPLAESTGLIIPIGQWVFDTAFAELKSWETQADKAGLQLSVNVSARQFHQADFVAQVRDSLLRSGADPARLKLELTESAVLLDVDESIQHMLALRELGITFALDDFGTGYSSLSYLKRLPLDQVKIDQSFVRDLTQDPNDAAIVRAILAMSHSLSLHVIAEGVETEAQRQFLIDNGCTDFQGFLFGKPLPMQRWMP